ncbi:hypothetical protein EDD86DRAFT_212982 [Gorgonomyces haynaldii]|nr:hypothetical protein EDD86DRAFT_212982 [Gorgonomyces haynaldii]
MSKFVDFVNALSLTELQQLYEIVENRLKKRDFMELPMEICWNIVKRLELEDLFRCSSVSKRWRRIASSDHLYMKYSRNPSYEQCLYEYTMKQKWKYFGEPQVLESTSPCPIVQLSDEICILGSQHHFVKIVSLRTLESRILETVPVSSVCYGDQSIFVGGFNRIIYCYRYPDLEPQYMLRGHAGMISCLHFDKKLYSGSSDCQIRVWQNDELEIVWQEAQNRIICIKSAQNRTVACADNRIRIYSQQLLLELEHEDVQSMDLLDNGQIQIVSCSHTELKMFVFSSDWNHISTQTIQFAQYQPHIQVALNSFCVFYVAQHYLVSMDHSLEKIVQLNLDKSYFCACNDKCLVLTSFTGNIHLYTK